MNSQNQNLKKNYSYFLELISATLNGKEVPVPEDDIDWQVIYNIATYHSLAGLLYYSADKLPGGKKPSGAVWAYLAQMYREQVVADLNLTFECERMLNLLSDDGVAVMPLKGIVTKADYPLSHLRTMTDVDILCDNREKAEKVFISQGYDLENRGAKHTSFRKDGILHFEIHETLTEESESKSAEYFSAVWDRSEFSENRKIARMTLEDTYLYMLEHLASHVLSGGAGLRMYIDVYLFLNKHGDVLDRVYVNKVLSTISLDEFEKMTLELCGCLFGDGEYTPELSVISEFIMYSSTFGRSKMTFVTDAIKEGTDSETSFKAGTSKIFRKIFPSFTSISRSYKAVKKVPVLYPFFFPVYWVERLFIKRNVNTSNIGNYFVTADSDEAKELKRIFSHMGLDKRI